MVSENVRRRVSEIKKSATKENPGLTLLQKVTEALKQDGMTKIVEDISFEDPANNKLLRSIARKLPLSGHRNNKIPVVLPEVPRFLSYKISQLVGENLYSLIARDIGTENARVKENSGVSGDFPDLALEDLESSIRYRIFNKPYHPFFNEEIGHMIISHLHEFYKDNIDKSNFNTKTLFNELRRYLIAQMSNLYLKSVKKRVSTPRKKS